VKDGQEIPTKSVSLLFGGPVHSSLERIRTRGGPRVLAVGRRPVWPCGTTKNENPREHLQTDSVLLVANRVRNCTEWHAVGRFLQRRASRPRGFSPRKDEWTWMNWA
jgi:hypothetical protein